MKPSQEEGEKAPTAGGTELYGGDQDAEGTGGNDPLVERASRKGDGESRSETSGDEDRHRNARKTRAVVDDHLKRREEGDLEADLRRNYREDVVMLTPTRVGRGHDGVRECAELLYKAIQDSQTYEYSSIVCDDRVALLEWSAEADGMKISDGVDSFVIEDGLICVQTIRYTVTFKDLSMAREMG